MCEACQSVRNHPPPVPLHSWPWPSGPRERIHIDYAGPFMGSMFLMVVDAYSKWLEVLPMASTTTEKTLDALRTLFARYGVPKEVVSDNGPQFTASCFEECLVTNGIRHTRASPYHPASNGEAERFVQTFKHSLKAGQRDKGTLMQKLSQFLLMYRTTPNTTTGVPPAELFLNRQSQTRLDLLKPSNKNQVLQKLRAEKIPRCPCQGSSVQARTISFSSKPQGWLQMEKGNCYKAVRTCIVQSRRQMTNVEMSRRPVVTLLGGE